MSFDDNENNFYVLEEREGTKPDDSPRNYASYHEEDIEEEEEDEEEDGETSEKNVSAFGLLLNIMFNPVEGWKKLRRCKISVESLQGGCFYPLLAILAVSKFAEFFYSVDFNLIKVISDAVVAFVAFFFSYFCIQMLFSWILPGEMTDKFELRFGKEYIMTALSSLALFSILTNLLPMLWPILFFLPIWTMYIMFKGVRFFKFESHEMRFYCLAVVAVIGMPLAFEKLLTILLPY